MKYPLAKSEWKWFFIGIIVITIMCLTFGTILFLITGEETFLVGSTILGVFFIWIKLIVPVLDRI